MKNNYINLISAIILSLAIIFSAVNISSAINKTALVRVDDNASQTLLMNADEAATYIGISTDLLVSKIKREKIEKYDLTVYDTYRFIPYLEIDGVMYFTKSELEKWAAYKTNNH
ncbi:MAG TPA: hypothetical protein VEF53_13840 [Patescibacteria group bacterium]|nr:hypothetical protein [Patescibacteria group bacterium]